MSEINFIGQCQRGKYFPPMKNDDSCTHFIKILETMLSEYICVHVVSKRGGYCVEPLSRGRFDMGAFSYEIVTLVNITGLPHP